MLLRQMLWASVRPLVVIRRDWAGLAGEGSLIIGVISFLIFGVVWTILDLTGPYSVLQNEIANAEMNGGSALYTLVQQYFLLSLTGLTLTMFGVPLLLMPLAATRESVSDNFALVWCRVQQLSPALVMIYLGYALTDRCFVFGLTWLVQYDRHTHAPTMPTGQPLDPGAASILLSLLYGLGSVIALGFLLFVFVLMLRACRIYRYEAPWPASCRWPAECEGCGYAVCGLQPTDDCPECGLIVEESLDPDRGLEGMSAWSGIKLALFSPARFGRRLIARSPTPVPLHILWWMGVLNFVLLLLGTQLSWLLEVVIFQQANITVTEHLLTFVESLGYGVEQSAVLALLILLGFVMLTSMLCTTLGFDDKTSLAHAAAQVMCYLSVLMPITVAMLLLIQATRHLTYVFAPNGSLPLMMRWLSLMPLGMVGLYYYLQLRILRGAERSNL